MGHYVMAISSVCHLAATAPTMYDQVGVTFGPGAQTGRGSRSDWTYAVPFVLVRVVTPGFLSLVFFFQFFLKGNISQQQSRRPQIQSPGYFPVFFSECECEIREIVSSVVVTFHGAT